MVKSELVLVGLLIGACTQNLPSVSAAPYNSQASAGSDEFIDYLGRRYIAQDPRDWTATEYTAATRVIDVDNCRTIHALQGGSPQFSSKGARVARADDDGTVWIWDLGTGELIHRVAAHESLDFNVPVLAISESGEVLGSAGGPESSLVLIDVASGQRIWSSRASADRISSLAFANNDRLLVTGGEDGIVRIWGAQAWSRSD